MHEIFHWQALPLPSLINVFAYYASVFLPSGWLLGGFSLGPGVHLIAYIEIWHAHLWILLNWRLILNCNHDLLEKPHMSCSGQWILCSVPVLWYHTPCKCSLHLKVYSTVESYTLFHLESHHFLVISLSFFILKQGDWARWAIIGATKGCFYSVHSPKFSKAPLTSRN